MAAKRKIIIDPGHGGSDFGAVVDGRQEKDDTLRLAFDLGNALERRGVEVVYTRINDVYDTPEEKAEIANHSDADYFISLHRNSMPTPDTASGVESLVFRHSSIAALLGKNINLALAAVGWTDLGVHERPGLAVLRRTQMPAVLVEIGFIDNKKDNMFFDENMAATGDAIADGVVQTFEEQERQQQESGELPGYYMIQTGAYRMRPLAEEELEALKAQGFPAFLVAKDGFFFVRAGAFKELDNAVRMEQELRRRGYNTLLVKS